MTTERIQRTPVSGYRSVLTLNRQDPAYHYRWVNDIDGRVELFLNGGYEHVTTKEGGDVGTKRVGTATNIGTNVSKPVGQGITAYLMKIKREWYDQDQQDKLKLIKEQERELYGQQIGAHGYGSITTS